MSDERDKVLKQDQEPDVEAHKKLAVSDEKASDEELETPDVEAHKVQHKVQH